MLNSTLVNHGTVNVEGALLVFDRRRSTMSQALPPYESNFVNRAGGRINMRDPSQLSMHWVQARSRSRLSCSLPAAQHAVSCWVLQFDNYGVFNITRGTVNVSVVIVLVALVSCP